MSEQDFKDPPRLLESLEGGGDLKAMLAAGKSETPDDARMSMLAAKIGIVGGLGGAGAAGAAGAGGASSAGAGAGAAGAKVVAGAASAVKMGLAAKLVGAVAIAGAVGGGAVAVHRAAQTASSAMPPAGIIAQPSATLTARTTSAAANPAPTDTFLAIADPFASASPSSTAVAKPAKSSAGAEDNSPSAELALLEKAQDALRSRPADALALTNEHARRFPKGSFIQEREVIAIEALAKSARKAEARARADRFKQSFPGSASIRRIDAILGD